MLISVGKGYFERLAMFTFRESQQPKSQQRKASSERPTAKSKTANSAQQTAKQPEW